MKNNIPPEWMTIEEVADHLRLSRSKIYGMAQRGEIPSSKVVGRWRIFRAEVIFLKGLPDVPESRPRSSVNS